MALPSAARGSTVGVAILSDSRDIQWNADVVVEASRFPQPRIPIWKSTAWTPFDYNWFPKPNGKDYRRGLSQPHTVCFGQPCFQVGYASMLDFKFEFEWFETEILPYSH